MLVASRFSNTRCHYKLAGTESYLVIIGDGGDDDGAKPELKIMNIFHLSPQPYTGLDKTIDDVVFLCIGA